MKVQFDFDKYINQAGDKVLLRVKDVDNDERGNTTVFTLENEQGEVITNRFDFDNEGARKGYYMFSKNLNGGGEAISETSLLKGKCALFDIIEADKKGMTKDGKEITYYNVRYSYPADREFGSQPTEPTPVLDLASDDLGF